MNAVSRSLFVAVFALLLASAISGPLLAQTGADSIDARFWSASGGYARQLAIGAGGFGMLGDTGLVTSTVNPYSVDPLFMLQNPAYVSHYPSYLWLETGRSSDIIGPSGGIGESFGATLGITDNVTAALILARSDAFGYSQLDPHVFFQLTGETGRFSYSPAENTWELLGSVHSGIVDYGLGVSYESSSSTLSGGGDTAASLANFSQPALSLGVLVKPEGGWLFDLGATLLFPSLSSSDGKIATTSFGVNTRAFVPLKPEYYLVPILNFYHAGATSTFVGTPADLSSTNAVDAGIGLNFRQGGLHVMSGVSFGYYKHTIPGITGVSQEQTTTQTIFPRWTIGAEWEMLRWLTARLGYFASSGQQEEVSYDAANNKITRDFGISNMYSPVTGSNFSSGAAASGISLGAGFHVDRFTADATIIPGALRAGLATLSHDLFGWVTLSYRFD